MEPNVGALERKVERAAKALAERMRERDEGICELARLGVGLDRIASVAGLTKGRVSQIVTKGRAEGSDKDEQR